MQHNAQSVTRKTPDRRDITLSKTANARATLAALTHDTEVYALTFGQFSLMDAVEAILEKTGISGAIPR